MDITKLDRKSFIGKIAEWRLEGTLDRRLASRATAKGHIHRVGLPFKPNSGLVSPAEYRRRSKKRNRRLLKSKWKGE